MVIHISLLSALVEFSVQPKFPWFEQSSASFRVMWRDVLLSPSFTPKQLGWFPRGEEGHDDNTVLQEMAWFSQAVGSSELKGSNSLELLSLWFTIHNFKSPSSGSKLLWIPKGKQAFELEDWAPFIMPTGVNLCMPSGESQGRKFLELCLFCTSDLTCKIIMSIFAIFCWCLITQSFCFCFPFKKYYFPSFS